MDISQSLLTIVGGVLIAVVSSRVTIHYSLKKFYSEKLWERRVDAYTAVLNALHDAMSYPKTLLDFEMHGVPVPDDRREELTERARKGDLELRRRLDLGNFLLSQEAVDALTQLRKELDDSRQAEGWVEALNSQQYALGKCLRTMRDIARKDLRSDER